LAQLPGPEAATVAVPVLVLSNADSERAARGPESENCAGPARAARGRRGPRAGAAAAWPGEFADRQPRIKRSCHWHWHWPGTGTGSLSGCPGPSARRCRRPSPESPGVGPPEPGMLSWNSEVGWRATEEGPRRITIEVRPRILHSFAPACCHKARVPTPRAGLSVPAALPLTKGLVARRRSV
jgi:hypothetical protein